MEGATDSDIPSQSAEKTSRRGDLHSAFVSVKDVVKGHAQWWRSDAREKIDTQTRKDPGASFIAGGMGVGIICAGC